MRCLFIIGLSWALFSSASCGDPADTSGDGALAEALARAGSAKSFPASTTVSLSRSDTGAHKDFVEVIYTTGLGTPGEQSVALRRRLSVVGRAFHLEVVRSAQHAADVDLVHEDGWEFIYDGRRAASRRRSNPWMARSEKDASSVEVDAFEDVEKLLRVFEPRLIWRLVDAPSTDASSEPQQWYEPVLRDPQPTVVHERGLATLRHHELRWDDWLAASHQLSAVSGLVARRDRDQGILSASVTFRGDLRVDDVDEAFRLRLIWRRDTLNPTHPFTVPTDLVQARRERPWSMINDVLGEALRGPYRRSD